MKRTLTHFAIFSETAYANFSESRGPQQYPGLKILEGQIPFFINQ